MSPSVVVFDIGGVLVDWQPHLAWSDDLGEEGAHAFMERVDFAKRNARADNGELFADLAAELDDAEDRTLLASYVARYPRTVQNAMSETWDVLDQLRANDVPVHAITNWSAETWPEGLKAQPRLAEVFGVTVVSGQEGVMKPDARIFQTLCDRAGVAAQDCIFIDDGAHNVKGAQEAGMHGIHFTGAEALDGSLREQGLL